MKLYQFFFCLEYKWTDPDLRKEYILILRTYIIIKVACNFTFQAVSLQWSENVLYKKTCQSCFIVLSRQWYI